MTENSTTLLPFPEVAGRLCLPASGEPVPAVVMLHGFASHADEVGGFYARMAAAFAASGLASFRFTFAGFDTPEEETVQTNLEDMIAEGRAAGTALAAHPRINADRIGLLGFSLGGATAVLAAASDPDRFKALATWSCAAELETSFRRYLGETNFERALAGEEIAVDLGWRHIRLGPDFVRSLVRHRPLERIRDYPNAFLAIAGSEDPLAVYLDRYFKNATGTRKEKLLISGADHIFNILEDPDRIAPTVIERTCDFFTARL